jgi:hypothetical protein
MLIEQNNTSKVSNNFTQKEYYDASFGTTGKAFNLSDATIKGGQIIRDYFGVPMKVTASYRTRDWDISKGRSGIGQHTQRTASDYAFLDDDTLFKFHKEILERGELYQALRNAGINGIGLYDNFLHIDSRQTGSTPDANFGSFAFWDSRTWSKKKTQ